ncbi:MAG: GNAT family N-acetyltransferase [Fretibacterium sp.]|nr:GNAT family N-acetyltransferase [Fretibacterium sp.]
MNIRNMLPEDYDAVYALWRSCPEMELNNLDDSREGVLRFLERNPETSFVAEEDGQVVGILLAGSDGRRGYIYHAGVLAEFRGRGIGTALIETALEKLRAMHITKVGLLVFRDNSTGLRFWEAKGFQAREDLAYRSCTLREITRLQ